ncbi:MAG: apolipoprotein N-acyltransferase [Planctomycetes bacterium]|nr:apolipoprotein N-acyltransferase [Planctomycetota bacterium]
MSTPDSQTVAPLKRLLAALATWALLFVAGPGIVTREGLWFIAAIALVPWALVCSRPGKYALRIEWLAAAIGISTICFWSTYVIWITLIAVALVPAVYMAFAGTLLRRLASTWPLVIAVPCAWISLETLRLVVEPPFGFGWLRLGHHAHSDLWLAGGARVWGTAGVGFALAAISGGIADLWRARPRGIAFGQMKAVIALALAPFLLCATFAATTSAPATVDGPRFLLVQPAFEQERKMSMRSSPELLAELVDLTRRGVAEAVRAGEPLDCVAWGEVSFPYPLAAPDLLAAFDRGARAVPWGVRDLTRAEVIDMRDAEREGIAGMLFGRDGKGAVLPPGAALVSGVEHWSLVDGALRRANAVLAWNTLGERTGLGGKVHLVPGAEHLCGLERLGWVRDAAQALAGYVPDFIDFDTAEVLHLEGREGRTWKMGTSVCFDNAFEGPYVDPLRAGDLDFHFIASNEAWYLESWEYDQMMAFSHMLAIETGRSIVRATNAGISCVIGPDGRDVSRLEILGKDRMVAGCLRAVVPVPATDARGGERKPRPIYVATQRAWTAVWIGLGILLAILARVRPVTTRT